MPGARKLVLLAAQTALLLAALLTPAPARGLEGSGGVLVVGDSLEVLTIPYLQRHLPGVALTTNAVGGYNSYQIYDLFQESYDPAQSVIVFDAGTNDNPAYPQILAGNLQQVAQRVGDRCLVVPTIHGLIVDGVDNRGKNAVVRSFAASRPGTQVPDWAGAVAAQPELLQSDDLHPTPAGADFRAQLIAQGVQGCLAYGGAGTATEAVESAPELPPARKFARRGAELTRTIALSLGEAVAMQVVLKFLNP